ncbi:MAG: NAD(+) synthase [Gemmatimonadota bacterium]
MPTTSLRLSDPESELAAGSAWLRDQLRAAGLSRVVLGLSGGIDSAVVATWAVQALGPMHVTCVAMPYGLLADSLFPPSSPSSLEHARLVAARFSAVDYRELDIAPTVDAEAASNGLVVDLRFSPSDEQLRLALANIKARIRAVRLRYFANRLGALLLGTENKTEHYLGYFTIGGDEESDLELIGNYFKAEVVQLAQALSVPHEVATKAPSADLWAGQSDEDELGFSYSDADRVLCLGGHTGALPDEIRAGCSVADAAISNVLARVRATAFKRAQKPVFTSPAL